MSKSIIILAALSLAVPAVGQSSGDAALDTVVTSCADMKKAWEGGPAGRKAVEEFMAKLTEDVRRPFMGYCFTYTKGYNDGVRDALRKTA